MDLVWIQTLVVFLNVVFEKNNFEKVGRNIHPEDHGWVSQGLLSDENQ